MKPGVPFLFVSSTAFQSMYYGQTDRKIRNFFKELRKAAREEGGAIGFIEEIDAIAGARSGMRIDAARPTVSARRVQVERSTSSEGISRRRQRAADPAAVVRRADERRAACRAGASTASNRFLPAHRQLKKKPPVASNILVIGATNRAADLDPALLRPGPVRPLDPLRPAEPLRPARDHRLLPRQEGARSRARQGRAPRPARGDDLRVLAGDDRAPLRRGARVGAARRARRHGLARRPAGEDHRGDRSRSSRSSTPTRRSARSRPTKPGHAVVAYLVGVRTASSRCCRSSSAATRSACSRTPTPRSATRAPVPS